ncbi:MAG: LacI family DNA-binding transcriptional regulator, partial [Ardenticatenaceae bacterium]
MKPITVKDVARAAEVSVATVSRVLNGNDTVDDALRQRVIAAAEKLDYRPNRLARNLRTNSTTLVALVLPDIQNPFFVAVARGVEEVTFREGYTLLVCNTDDEQRRETSYFQVLNDEVVAGIIVCATDEERAHKEMLTALKRGVAVVALDRYLKDLPVDSVLSDNVAGAYHAVSYLIELGHRRIGLVAGASHYTPGRERRLGYEQALADHGLALDADLIQTTNFRTSGAEVATRALLNLAEPPTALFISSGNLAPGSLRIVNRRKLRIPDDISILLFDDPEWAGAYNPPLTAVAQDTRELGIMAGRLLLQRIRGAETPPQEWRLPTQLIV